MALERDREAVGSVEREVNDRVAQVGWIDAEIDTLDFLCECGARTASPQ